MKGFKKGIALFAVLAFLITAILPVAAMAAPETRVTKDVPQGGSVDFVASGVSNLPSDDGTQYVLEPKTGAQQLPRDAYTVDIAGTTLTITFRAGYLTQLGESTYDLWWVDPQYGYRLDCQASVTVNVTEATTATVVVPSSAEQGTTQTAQLVGTTETATWAVEPAGQGVTIDPATGAITIAPDATPGTYTVTATLPDGTAVTATMEVTEVAAPATYTVTAAATANGTITANPATAEEGALITVTATPDNGYRLDAVTTAPETTVTVSGNTATFTMPAANVTVSATFAARGTLSDIDVEPAWLSADVPEAAQGETVTLTVDLSDPQYEGQDLSQLTILDADGNKVPYTQVSATEYTFVMPDSAVTVSATLSATDEPKEITNNADGVTVSPASAKPGETVTVSVPAGENPPKIVGADGNEIPLTGPDADGNYTFTMPNQSVTVGEAADIPRPAAAGIITGENYLNGTSNYSPFTYWMQPRGGLFSDGENGENRHPVVPVGAVQNAGDIKNHFQIGPNAAVCDSVSTAPLTLNNRIQIWYDPQNIFIDDDNDAATPLLQLQPNNWSDYVTMEWEFKPSTNDEDDGNPLKIPVGLGFSGVRSPLLTVTPLTEQMDGWWVRLAVYPKPGTAARASAEYYTTRWIRIDLADVNGTLDPVVTISSNPEAVGSIVNVPRGGDAVLTASVANRPYGSVAQYQWQSMAKPTAANPTPTWVNVAGGTEQSLVLSGVTDAMTGTAYQCVVTCRQNGPDGLGTITTSRNSLTLNVTEPNGSVFISGTTPSGSSLIFKIEGSTLPMAVAARTDNGDPMKYQWYVRSYLAPVPASIQTVADAAAYLAGAAAEPVEGATSPGFTSEPLRVGVYGFSCRVENANNPAMAALSPVIYVVVGSEAQMSIYPEPGTIRSVGVVNGLAVSLKARAGASDVTYTWQRYNPVTQVWNTLTATGKTLTLPALTTQATGTLYRCAISVPGTTQPMYTGWYLLNVWDTANTPQITRTAMDVRWTLAELRNNAGRMELQSQARIAQDLNHGDSWVGAVWYNAAGNVVSVQPLPTDTDGDGRNEWIANAEFDWASTADLFTSSISYPGSGSNTYTSTLKLSGDGLAALANDPENTARALNGTYTCVWYKPQTEQEWGNPTEYKYAADTDVSPNMDEMRLLAPQAVRGYTTIQIQIPGDPWIITDLPDEMTVAVGQRATLSVAATITQPSDTNTPVYTWQVSENADSISPRWRNCLSSDGTGQFTPTFTTRVMTQDDFDSNRTLSYRVIVASRPNVAKIVSNTCDLVITEGTPQAPAITPGPGSPIRVENGQATGVEVSKTGTTVSKFLQDLNASVPAGCSLRITGSDGQVLAADAIIYTGCVLQLVDDATQDVVAMATIIVSGDVLGTGLIAINQVVRMAQDLNGSRPLDGIYEQAGDFNGSGAIDIADLVKEAQILSEPVDVQ